VVEESSLPECLTVAARTADGIVMAIGHRRLPVIGWQFHPESILTEKGYALLAGFLREAGLPVPGVPDLASELLPENSAPEAHRPSSPLKFY
jgi:hypothetical protein